jgi:hypothetical protein
MQKIETLLQKKENKVYRDFISSLTPRNKDYDLAILKYFNCLKMMHKNLSQGKVKGNIYEYSSAFNISHSLKQALEELKIVVNNTWMAGRPNKKMAIDVFNRSKQIFIDSSSRLKKNKNTPTIQNREDLENKDLSYLFKLAKNGLSEKDALKAYQVYKEMEK